MDVTSQPRELGDCLSKVIDHRGKTPKKLGSDWVSEGVPTLSAKNVNSGRIVAEDAIRYVTPDIYRRWMNTGDVERGDCFLVSEGATLGECMYWDNDYPVVLGQRLFCLRANPDVLYPRFLYYYMTTHAFQADVVGRTTGTSVFGLRQTDVLKLTVNLPSLYHQKFIGDVLYFLDKKIELNRQMNATLEAMAQALFKSWFVDFDPVIDNALAAGNPIPEPLQKRAEARKALTPSPSPQGRGEQKSPRPLGEGLGEGLQCQPLPIANGCLSATLPEAIQKQFPNRFVFNEDMGWMPEGWEPLTFEELVEAKQGRYLAKDEMLEQPNDDHQYPVWGGNGILGFAKQCSYDLPVTLMTCRGSNCGLIKSTQSAAWVSNNSFAFRTKYGSEYFLYLYFLNEDFSECISGSAQPQITYTALRNKRMKFPVSQRVADTFSALVEPYRKQQFKNEEVNNSLTALRDTLLPKLLSGQLRIPDAEKQLAEAL